MTTKYDVGQVVYALDVSYLYTSLCVRAVKIMQIEITDYDNYYYVAELGKEHEWAACQNQKLYNEKFLFNNKQELKQELNKIADNFKKTKELTERGLPNID